MVSNSIKKTEEMDPIFIHSLWRSGSTYVFNTFRRSPSNYWCYQEPMNEFLLENESDPYSLLEFGAGLTDKLRHPHLEKPYLQELLETHYEWKGKLKKSDIYDDYFSNSMSKSLYYYINSLITSAKGRPVIQECRTSSRIGVIRKNIGGTHIYLWRNPWDQWWSYKLSSYFDTVVQLILNSPNVPSVIEIFKNIIKFESFHDEKISNEFKHFNIRMLPQDQSYLLFFLIWSLGFIESQKHADFTINIDMLTESNQYKSKILENFSKFSIKNMDFADCNVHRSLFFEADEKFFRTQEKKAYSLMLASGIDEDTIDLIKKSISENRPSNQHIVQKPKSFLERDVFRLREITIQEANENCERVRTIFDFFSQQMLELSSRISDFSSQKIIVDNEILELHNQYKLHIKKLENSINYYKEYIIKKIDSIDNNTNDLDINLIKSFDKMENLINNTDRKFEIYYDIICNKFAKNYNIMQESLSEKERELLSAEDKILHAQKNYHALSRNFRDYSDLASRQLELNKRKQLKLEANLAMAEMLFFQHMRKYKSEQLKNERMISAATLDLEMRLSIAESALKLKEQQISDMSVQNFALSEEATELRISIEVLEAANSDMVQNRYAFKYLKRWVKSLFYTKAR